MMPITTPSRRRLRNLRSASPRTRRGFTLIELLVAISILAIMLFLINIIFIQTTRAVSTGVRQSNILAVGRAANDRISRDASAMLGPNSQNPAPEGGGYIVIINHRIVAPVKRADGTERLESFRVDQLVFMASAETAASKVTQFRGAAPRDASQYGSDFASPFALVRYGHGQRTNRDGTDQAGWVELGFDRNSGLDRLANDWMFVRQAVLFNPTDSQNPPQPIQAGDWYADWPFVQQPVVNAGGLMVDGYCDVVPAPPANADPAVGFVDGFLDPTSSGLSAAAIDSNYLSLAYTIERQRINPLPAATDFEAIQVGRLHGIFAPNCSDFIVQFAADTNGDGEVDRSDNGTPGNPSDDFIIWYDFDSGFPTEWVAGTGDANAPLFTPGYINTLNPNFANHATTAFVFRMDDDQAHNGTVDAANTKWPYLIRIRYRLHDAPGRIEGNATFRQFDGISNDDDNNDGLVDGTDDIDETDEQFVSGQYFEQIIRVPRPQTP